MSVRGKGQELVHQWWDHPLVSGQQEVLIWGCSAPAAFPPLDLGFSTIFTQIFGVQMNLCSVFLRYRSGSKQGTKPEVHQVDPKSKSNLLQAILLHQYQPKS